MTKKQCLTCRWWEGDRGDYGDKTSVCHRIHVGHSRNILHARIYPIGSGAWLETHRDFGCELHEIN